MTHAEIIKKLIGNISPAGASHIDDERFENLKAMCELIESLVEDVHFVAERNKSSHEFSVKRSGEYAEKFLSTLINPPQ